MTYKFIGVHRGWRLFLLHSLVCAIGLTKAASVHAQSALAASNEPSVEILEAEKAAANAIRAYREGKPDRAIELYWRAHALAASADILFNIARIYDWSLGNQSEAKKLYERAIREPGAGAERIAKARQRLEELEAIAERVEPAKALTKVEIGALPTLGIVTGLSRPQAPQSDAPSSVSHPIGWTLGAGGVVALAAGVGLALSASAKAETVKADCDGSLCQSEEGVNAARNGLQHANWATGAFISSGVLLGISTWIFLDEDKPSKRNVGSLKWDAEFGMTDVFLRIRGQW